MNSSTTHFQGLQKLWEKYSSSSQPSIFLFNRFSFEKKRALVMLHENWLCQKNITRWVKPAQPAEPIF